MENSLCPLKVSFTVAPSITLKSIKERDISVIISDNCHVDLREKIEALTDLQRTALIVGEGSPSSFGNLLSIGHIFVEQYWIGGCNSIALYCPRCDTVYRVARRDYDTTLRNFLLGLLCS